MNDKLIPILARVLGVDECILNSSSSAENIPAWDSLRHFMILMELEEAFKITLPLETFAEAMSVRKIEDVLTQALSVL